MALLKQWAHAQFRDMYDFEHDKMNAKHPGNDFATTITLNGLFRWGYSLRGSGGPRREAADYDIYVNERFLLDSETEPQHLVDWNTPSLAFWLYERVVYAAEGHDLSAEDVRALANVAANKRRLQLEKAYALQAMTDRLDSRSRRERIPQEVKIAVWQRDMGRCVECGEQKNLEFDHVIPLAMGGSNTERNLQLLCETCNRRKGASLG